MANLSAVTFEFEPAQRSGDRPIFGNESRGFKYFTEIEISKKLQNSQNSRVSVVWTGGRIYRQVGAGKVVLSLSSE